MQITTFMHGIFDSETTDVLECGNCGLQFLDPMMSEQEEEEYYTDYYEQQKGRHYAPMSLKDIQERALGHYEQYKSEYLSFLRSNTEILEIGSGAGGFLRFILKNLSGTRLTSVERSESNRNFLKDSSTNPFSHISFHEFLSDIQGKTFDTVIAFGVLEHIRNTSHFLLAMHRLLKDTNSHLVLSIPNKNNPLIYRYDLQEFKKFNYMRQHHYTFSENSIDILARRCGFRVEAFHYLQVWSLDNHLSWLRHKQPRDFSDITTTLSSCTLQSYNKDLIHRKTTDLLMVALKPQP